jgi:transporter family-2 protein
MPMKLVFAALAMLAGVAVACQGATNQSLLKVAGIGPTLLLNSLIALVGVTCLWFATGAPTTFFPARTAWTRYLGGVFGFIVMVAIVLVFPRLGAAYAIALMVCGQCVAAMIIDHYGLMAIACDWRVPRRGRRRRVPALSQRRFDFPGERCGIPGMIKPERITYQEVIRLHAIHLRDNPLAPVDTHHHHWGKQREDHRGGRQRCGTFVAGNLQRFLRSRRGESPARDEARDASGEGLLRAAPRALTGKKVRWAPGSVCRLLDRIDGLRSGSVALC